MSELPLAYGEAGDGLVFIPRTVAEELATLRSVIESAETWGDFRQAMSSERWRDIVERVVDGEEAPDDAHAFDADALPGYSDGDWPEWPAQQMLEWVPAHIQSGFGEVKDSVVNGPFLRIDPSAEEGAVAAFEEAGYSCEEDTGLVLDASGLA